MRRAMASAIVAMGAAALVACHTITEDLPSRPSQVVGVPGSIPVIVVPIPALTPNPNQVPSPSSPIAPSPNPRPTAAPDEGGGGGGSPTQNRAPVERLNAGVYFVECNGAAVPDSGRSATAPVGCRLHLDCTPRDSSNAPTNARGTPQWTYSNPGLVNGGNSGYNPTLTIKAAGHMDIYAEVDGVRSATFGVDFQ